MVQQKTRSALLDVLKGTAIICVVLFHIGLFPYGYLGVDVFFVIAGYLTTCSIIKQYDKNGFSYWNFLLNRLVRLWPLLLIVSWVSLVAGYYTMLPTSYKNTAETVWGTSVFLNNFVQYITAGDYWDASNEYKPLMHTWYVGVLFQFYLLFPLLFMIAHRFTKKWKSTLIILLSISGLGSLILYILPVGTETFDFYMLPSRFFEFAVGGVLAIPALSRQNKIKWFSVSCFILLWVLLITNTNIEATQYRLLLTVIVCMTLIWISKNSSTFSLSSSYFKPITIMGMASYSIYIWHQAIFAFYRNIWNDHLHAAEYVLLILVSLVVGMASYYGIEQPIDKLCKRRKTIPVAFIPVCVLVPLPLWYFSAKYYRQEGVVRDIPELKIFMDKPDTWIPQAYNSAVYREDKDFPNNGKANVLLVGDSYARDWYNVIKESDKKRLLNLSYHEKADIILWERISQADCIFLVTHGDFERFNAYLPQMMKKEFYRVGDKCYFSSPNIIYNRRHDKNYLKQKIKIPSEIKQSNRAERQMFGKAFINSMDVMKNRTGQYDIFTPDGFLISHDGLHLTQAGAQFYAAHLNKPALLRTNN